ncbi:MAG: bacteriohemerythrin [candidate division FCPU426 bacterium]
MALIQWNDSFRVNIVEIDHQHQQLVGMINAMHQAMLQGTARETMGRTISELLSYASRHFASEERLFDRYGYPEAPAHKLEHEAFVAKVSEFKSTLESRQLSLSISVMQYLYGWVVNHIKGSDQKYAPFLTSKGVK